jgi:hypothetical protein
MSRRNDLTAFAVEGYKEVGADHLATSPAWCARQLGRYFDLTGRPEPRDVRMGRGDSIRANDMRFTFAIFVTGSANTISFERVE